MRMMTIGTAWAPWTALQGPHAMEWVLVISLALVVLGSGAQLVSVVQLKRKYDERARRLKADLAEQRARAESLNTVATFVQHSKVMRIVADLEKQLETLNERRATDLVRFKQGNQSRILRVVTSLSPFLLWWALRRFTVLEFDCRLVWPLNYLPLFSSPTGAARFDAFGCDELLSSHACVERCALSAFAWYGMCTQAFRGIIAHILAKQGI
ncbi:hypothetical protein FVE85_4880 [Porphyridium purpureum]|uniref:Uncharacterized protein n=1 Tax=Porphyridium purpureum TaxID=35688 RepID=A0A5J4YSF7_PORPP|nr:hypothetical protein FVE85_4880 [Porphyridium purpureum]|eukprot:POR0952..scf236_6